MKVGLSTATFFGRSTTENSFEYIKYCGVDIAEVFLTTYMEYQKSFGELLQKNKGDINIHSIHTLNSQFEPELYNSIERTYRESEKIFKSALEVGQMLGAKYYTFHGPARLKRFREPIFDYDKLAKRTAQLFDIAKSYGITLSYENVHWAYYHFPGYFNKIKTLCDLKGTLDIKQAFQSNHDYREFLSEMGENISTVHVVDYDKDYNLCPLGRGIFDFKELINRLKDFGLDIPIMIELYYGDYKTIDDVKESCEYLRSLI